MLRLPRIGRDAWPHHVPKEWADRYKGRFDQGWDTPGGEIVISQKDLGVVPPDTELTARGAPAGRVVRKR